MSEVLLTASIAVNIVILICTLLLKRRAARQMLQLGRMNQMAVLGRMAGGIAHEIGSPLATILLLVEQNLEDLAADSEIDREVWRRSQIVIETAARHIANVVRGMRSAGREAARDPFAKLLLAEVVRETLLVCGDRLERDEIAVEISLAENVEIEGRSAQLMQVLMNLLTNARDAICNRTEERWIRIEARDLGEQVELAVTNSGPTIPDAIRRQLFRPFYTTKEPGKGTGLGLNISRGIAESHGGQLSLSENSPHTRFQLRLPKKQRRAAA